MRPAHSQQPKDEIAANAELPNLDISHEDKTKCLDESLAELDVLIGIDAVKAEVKGLVNF